MLLCAHISVAATANPVADLYTQNHNSCLHAGSSEPSADAVLEQREEEPPSSVHKVSRIL